MCSLVDDDELVEPVLKLMLLVEVLELEDVRDEVETLVIVEVDVNELCDDDVVEIEVVADVEPESSIVLS